ncbi:unnamed protein product [Dimorphilus gyrociliatus]|uniref:Uncharacterized protein n=1 Tax=Dimorphilus gyrociliatus TaxID=2664684 RepID=A0A7I8WEF9_9ANNE|nr:unnamed protein product [Dimorphilus gyrociliatus]
MKNGSQHAVKAPMMTPNVIIALPSRLEDSLCFFFNKPEIAAPALVNDLRGFDNMWAEESPEERSLFLAWSEDLLLSSEKAVLAEALIILHRG